MMKMMVDFAENRIKWLSHDCLRYALTRQVNQ